MAGGLVNLGMIGGFLHQKTPEIVSEYLPVAKMLDGGGGLQSVMSRVLQGGGLQAVLSNPLSAVGAQLQGTLAQGVASLSGVPGVGPLVSSLTGPGGLSGSASGLVASAQGLLSGQGLLGVLSHSSVASAAGSSLPSQLGLDRVLGPLFADGALSSVDLSVGSVVLEVLSGSSVAEATLEVQRLSSGLQAVADASSSALLSVGGPLATSAGLAADISAVHALAAVVASGRGSITSVVPASLYQAYVRNLDDDVVQQMLESVATH